MKTTIQDVILDLTFEGGDRCAVVRHEKPGVIVLMTSPAAIHRIAPGLLEIAVKHCTEAEPPTHKTTENEGVTEIFEIADRNGGFHWFKLEFGKMEIMAGVFTNPKHAVSLVADHCNRNGAPCSLDPRKAAPGYEITETREGTR